jgi:hypothetical protein
LPLHPDFIGLNVGMAPGLFDQVLMDLLTVLPTVGDPLAHRAVIIPECGGNRRYRAPVSD